MNKTIITLAITSLFSVNAFAATTVSGNLLGNGAAFKITGDDGNAAGVVVRNDGSILLEVDTDSTAGYETSQVDLVTEGELASAIGSINNELTAVKTGTEKALADNLQQGSDILDLQTQSGINEKNIIKINEKLDNIPTDIVSTGQLNSTATGVMMYADSEINKAKDEAKAYVDAALAGSTGGVSEATVDSKVTAGVTESKNYTNAKFNEAKKYAKSEADRAENNAIAYAAAGDEALSKKIDKTNTELTNKFNEGQEADAKARAEMKVEQAKIDAAQNKTNAEARAVMKAAQVKTDAAQDARHSAYVKEQAKVDAYMQAGIDELYAQDAHRGLQIKGLEDRMSKVEGLAQQNANDIKAIKKGMAAMAAVAGLVEPKYAGDTTISVGVASALDEGAIAFGGTHNFNDNVAVKVTFGTDTKFKEQVYTAAAGYSF